MAHRCSCSFCDPALATHAPEPWITRKSSGGLHCIEGPPKSDPTRSTKGLNDPDQRRPIAHLVCPKDADRIVVCVNACEGLNPQAIPKLIAMFEDGWLHCCDAETVLGKIAEVIDEVKL